MISSWILRASMFIILSRWCLSIRKMCARNPEGFPTHHGHNPDGSTSLEPNQRFDLRNRRTDSQNDTSWVRPLPSPLYKASKNAIKNRRETFLAVIFFSGTVIALPLNHSPKSSGNATCPKEDAKERWKGIDPNHGTRESKDQQNVKSWQLEPRPSFS